MLLCLCITPRITPHIMYGKQYGSREKRDGNKTFDRSSAMFTGF